jgi:hypothetical protein
MTKLELMDYCWSRDFGYTEVLNIACRSHSTDIPTKEEYAKYSQDAFEEMVRWMDWQYEDSRTEEQRATDELSHNFQQPYDTDR